MTIVALLSGKASPGVTTTAVALAAAWPGPVALVDADPAGGDIVPGWLSHWWVSGVIARERGIVSFAAASRGLPVQALPAEALAGHVHVVPTARHVMVLPGVAHQAEAEALTEAGWQQLAAALRDLTHADGPDVIIDAGRINPVDSPWPLISEADRVLVGVRGSLRHLNAAHTACRVLDEVLDRDQLGLAVCAGGDRRQIQNALDLPIEIELPRDPSAASGFSDGGTHPRQWQRSLLWRSAALAARRLRHQTRTGTAAEGLPAASAGQHSTTDPGTDHSPHDGKENPR
jgi:hypothetical protein